MKTKKKEKMDGGRQRILATQTKRKHKHFILCSLDFIYFCFGFILKHYRHCPPPHCAYAHDASSSVNVNVSVSASARSENENKQIADQMKSQLKALSVRIAVHRIASVRIASERIGSKHIHMHTMRPIFVFA